MVHRVIANVISYGIILICVYGIYASVLNSHPKVMRLPPITQEELRTSVELTHYPEGLGQ